MRFLTSRILPLALAAIGLTSFATDARAQVKINEIRIDQTGTDTDEYFELSGPSLMSLSGLTYIVVGDSGSVHTCGVIEVVVHLDGYAIHADGYFAAADSAETQQLTGYDARIPGTTPTPGQLGGLNFENTDNFTHMLVSGFTGLNGQDLDTNDDGVLDVTPWTSVVDAVGLSKGTTPNCSGEEYIYTTTVVGPDGGNVPGHVYRCSDTGLWKIGLFSPLGATDTPGRKNLSCRGALPAIISESREPCAPLVGQSAAVTAVLSHATGGNVYYTVNNGSEILLPMAFVGLSGSDSVFRATVPGRPTNGDLIKYHVRSFNANPDTVSGFAQGYFVGTVGIGTVRVNDAAGQSSYRLYGARVRGAVTVADGVFSTIDTDYYIQDATGGINVFKFGRHQARPGLGDDITVAGVLDQFRGKLEITDGGPCDTLLVTINDVGAPPDPIVVNTCNFDENDEGLLVRMNRLQLATTDSQFPANLNADYAIVNCSRDTVVMRVDKDTDIDGRTITSTYINLVGIAAQFDSIPPYDIGYQVTPRSHADITFLSPTAVGGSNDAPAARLLPGWPNPFSRSAQIRYQIPQAAASGARVRVRLMLLDVQGRVVKTLVDEFQDAGDHLVTVDGGALRSLGSGLHFYRLEVAGKIHTQKAVLIR